MSITTLSYSYRLEPWAYHPESFISSIALSSSWHLVVELMTQNRSNHLQPRAAHSIYKPNLTGSQVIDIIHNPELFIPSKALRSRPRVFHVNHYLELFIISKALSL